MMRRSGRGFAWVSAGFVGLSMPAFGAGSDTPDGSVVITGAQILAGITIAGDTSDNTDFGDSGTVPLTDCGPATAPDEWYRIQIGGGTGTIAIDVDGCGGGTLYDSKFFLLDSVGSVIACSDDGCGVAGAASRLENVVLAPGSYDLAIDGFATHAGMYEAVLREFVPVPCFLDPPCSGVPEGEPCDEINDDTTNGGCNSTPNVFGTITIDGPPVCGIAWANGGHRDTDWYAFSVAVPWLVEIEVRGEADVTSFALEMSAGGACPVVGIPPDGAPAFSGDCDTNRVFGSYYLLDPGDYVLFVGTGGPDAYPIFDGFPCPDGTLTNNAYEVQLRSGGHGGSCCLENGECYHGIDGIGQQYCLSLGGVYQGVLCYYADCSAACCIESVCVDLWFDDCLAQGGAYQGAGTSCSGTTCPSGACCLADGNCSDGLTAVQCASVGVYQGDETLCSGVTCAPVLPVGACCFFPSGLCIDGLTGAECANAGGDYEGDDLTCGEVACPAQPSGACCIGDVCVAGVTPAACANAGGVFEGDDTICGPASCCGADLNGNGVVDFADILAIISAWGPCPPVCPEDLDGSGEVGFGDILVVIGSWGSCP